MTRMFALLFFAALCVAVKAQQKVIPLYDGPPPGSESWDWQEGESDSNMAHIALVYNVVKPTLTVVPAEGKANGTAVVICPGGGFHILSINSEGFDVAHYLAKKGVTCFVLKYRLARIEGKNPVQELATLMTVNLKKFNDDNVVAIPLGIADARAALKYVRTHAAVYNIDPDRIGIVGFSAGGTLAESTAFDYTPDTRPAFVAPIYAYVPQQRDTDVAKDAPPMFLAVASDDNLHLVPHSLLLYNKWLAAGKPVELHVYEKGGHGFGMHKQNLTSDTWIDRFAEWLDQRGLLRPAGTSGPSLLQQQEGMNQRQQQVLTDFANLKRFEEENLAVALSGGEGPHKRVVFMGNSITEGWLRLDSGFFYGRDYINRGISGQTTPQMLLRFRQDVLDLKPNVVVILAGTNDIAGNTGPTTLETIMGNIASMAELAKAHNIKVVLSSVLPAFDYPWRPGLQPAEKIVALNAMIKTYCENNDCVYLDYYNAMVDDRKGLPASLSPDGVHPNLAGYKIMEPLVEKAIARAMK